MIRQFQEKSNKPPALIGCTLEAAGPRRHCDSEPPAVAGGVDRLRRNRTARPATAGRSEHPYTPQRHLHRMPEKAVHQHRQHDQRHDGIETISFQRKSKDGKDHPHHWSGNEQ
jgi:hypothetical protein